MPINQIQQAREALFIFTTKYPQIKDTVRLMELDEFPTSLDTPPETLKKSIYKLWKWLYREHSVDEFRYQIQLRNSKLSFIELTYKIFRIYAHQYLLASKTARVCAITEEKILSNTETVFLREQICSLSSMQRCFFTDNKSSNNAFKNPFDNLPLPIVVIKNLLKLFATKMPAQTPIAEVNRLRKYQRSINLAEEAFALLKTNPREAAKKAKDAKDINGKNYLAWAILGTIIGDIGKLNEAIKITESNFDFALTQRGIIYLKQGNFAEARNDLQKALKLNPNYAAAIAALDEIPQNFNSQVTSNRPTLEQQRNNAIKTREQRKLNAALISFNSLLAQYPNDVATLYERGKTYLQMYKYEAAYQDFEHIEHLNPSKKYKDKVAAKKLLIAATHMLGPFNPFARPYRPDRDSAFS